jgi:hypothetical protein
MALLDDLLGGGSNGGLLNGILGGSNNESSNVDASSSSSDTTVATSPALGLGLSDVLQSSSFNSDGSDGDVNAESFSGIGDLGLGLSAPTLIGLSNSDESFSGSQSETNGGGGGLLGGLL